MESFTDQSFWIHLALAAMISLLAGFLVMGKGHLQQSIIGLGFIYGLWILLLGLVVWAFFLFGVAAGIVAAFVCWTVAGVGGMLMRRGVSGPLPPYRQPEWDAEARRKKVIASLVEGINATEQVEQDVLRRARSNSELNAYLDRQLIDDEILITFYRQLNTYGCSYAKETVASLPAVEYVVDTLDNSPHDQHNKWLKIAYDLTIYFDSGGIGPIR